MGLHPDTSITGKQGMMACLVDAPVLGENGLLDVGGDLGNVLREIRAAVALFECQLQALGKQLPPLVPRGVPSQLGGWRGCKGCWAVSAGCTCTVTSTSKDAVRDGASQEWC